MDCPAHPLLAAHARQAGFTVDARPWEEAAVNGDDRGPVGTTVVAVSYERPEGGHRGIALAARSEDGAAVAFVHRQIESWQAVLRTRRVLYVSEETPLPAAPPEGSPRPGHTPAPHAQGPWAPTTWTSGACTHPPPTPTPLRLPTTPHRHCPAPTSPPYRPRGREHVGRPGCPAAARPPPPARPPRRRNARCTGRWPGATRS